jgi:hypothetical protein
MPERGLWVRLSLMAAGHNALRRSGPGQKHAVALLHWLKWGVLISGSTGWVHHSSLALSNLVSAAVCPVPLPCRTSRGQYALRASGCPPRPLNEAQNRRRR